MLVKGLHTIPTTVEDMIEFLKSKEFMYARYNSHDEDWAKEVGEDGYYDIYKRNNESATGASLLFTLSIDEWELYSGMAGLKEPQF